ncbi:MAG: N-acyl-D-amino-acid deacylase family protein [Acidimicrobiales bacterium]
MAHDLVIKGGLVVDGTGAPARRADVAVDGDRITAVGGDVGAGSRTIDAEGRIVTPGFVDIHTHLDAALAWDPIATSSCWHGVTSAVMGNCGVTFAPVRPDDKDYLAKMMESVEDIPADSILSGLAWDWTTYGEYLASYEKMPKGINVGGLVGHCAVRYYVMGPRSLDEDPATATVDDIARMCELVDEAMAAGALGFSTSRTPEHKVPDGRKVPGTYAGPDELLAIADVLARHGRGVFEVAPDAVREGGPEFPVARRELAWMEEVSRRSGRPVSYGLAQERPAPDGYQALLRYTRAANERGARIRPQTTSRPIGILFGVANRTPYDKTPAWRALRGLSIAEKLAVLRDPERRAELVAAVRAAPPRLSPDDAFYLGPDHVRYQPDPEQSLAAHARRRGVEPVEAFIDIALETGGQAAWSYPFLNHQPEAVVEMLSDTNTVLGLADAGAHVGQIMDTSQPTYFLTYWVRERQQWTLEDAIRRMTSDTAELFGIADRGVVRPGAFADLNVIDFEGLALPAPEYVYDLPGGAGRYVQRSVGYEHTIVNGQPFMEGLEHAGALAGRILRSTD